MLSRLLRELLFALLHCLLTVYEVFSKCLEHFHAWWSPRESLDSYTEYIARNVAVLKRKPQHLVIFAERKWFETKELADLALWSLLAGIPYLSFYDSDGTLKQKEAELFKEVEKRKCGVPGCIKWVQRHDLNGYSNGHKPFTSTINILTPQHGKRTVAHFVRDLVQHKVTCRRESDQYTPEEIDPVLKLYYPDMPDPDVVTYCGPLCSPKGLLPWQIRLSEFIRLEKYEAVRPEDFVLVLRKYSKCDQRFGK